MPTLFSLVFDAPLCHDCNEPLVQFTCWCGFRRPLSDAFRVRVRLRLPRLNPAHAYVWTDGELVTSTDDRLEIRDRIWDRPPLDAGAINTVISVMVEERDRRVWFTTEPYE